MSLSNKSNFMTNTFSTIYLYFINPSSPTGQYSPEKNQWGIMRASFSDQMPFQTVNQQMIANTLLSFVINDYIRNRNITNQCARLYFMNWYINLTFCNSLFYPHQSLYLIRIKRYIYPPPLKVMGGMFSPASVLNFGRSGLVGEVCALLSPSSLTHCTIYKAANKLMHS